MTEKISKLLSKVKELIDERRFSEALSICDNILIRDENNINALLMTTKCLMDLERSPNEILKFLNKVLILKPNNPIAMQALRKFYQKYLRLFTEDAVLFYYQLHESDQLSCIDIEVISLQVTKLSLSPKAEERVIKCLLSQIKNKSNDICLRSFFDMAVEKYILYQNKILLEKLFDHLAICIIDDDSENVIYVRNMATFVKNILDDKNPESVYNVMSELCLKNIYTLVLFARLLCDHYLMVDCENNVKLGMEQLKSTDIHNQEVFAPVLINIRFENLIHLGDISDIETFWLNVDVNILSKYLKCQAFATGFNIFTGGNITWKDVSYNWSSGLTYYQQNFCRALMHEDIEQDVVKIHQILVEAPPLTSFEWYLWAKLLKSLDYPDKVYDAFKIASGNSKVYFKVYIELAEIYSENKDCKKAVTYLEKGLEYCFSQEMVEAYVDLNIKWKKYDEPVKVLALLDIDNCSNSLLLKFVECLKNLNRITDAISVIQRVVKKCPTQSEYWQLLGDLYLRRNNVNHAFKTYQKCVQLSGESLEISARLGNVYSLSYQDTLEENEFYKSIDYFEKSIRFGISKEALEGKTSTLFLHAKICLKQLMLPAAIKDINTIVKLLTNYNELLKDTVFQMNLLGKVLLLSIMGSVDNFIDVTSVKDCFFRDLIFSDILQLSEKCFEEAIRQHHYLVDSHFHVGVLELFKLNKYCGNVKRGQNVYPILYNKIENHFKETLALDKSHGDAWKYLGYLYLKHGMNLEELTLDTQHCLSMAINLSCDMNRINDPEAAFYLGLLYIRENQFRLAREVFDKIKMDYPINALGFIGMYFLSAKDHNVLEQQEIAKALMCYVYKDESTNIHESYNQFNMSVVSLFAENMGFLVHSLDTTLVFNSQIDLWSLFIALKMALDNAWTQYLVYTTTGVSFTEEEEKQLNEFGCFLGFVELLLGNHDYGKTLVMKSAIKTQNQICLKACDLIEINGLWKTFPIGTFIDKVMALSQLKVENKEMNKSSFSAKEMDAMFISAIIEKLSSPDLTSTVNYVNTLVSATPCLLSKDLTTETRVSILLALGSFILTLPNKELASSFLEIIYKSYSDIANSDDRLMRVISRVKMFEDSAEDVLYYLNNQCLKQPYEMNRWLNLLEFGLEYFEQLNTSFSLEKLFFWTHRSWCMTALDFERYSRILSKFSHLITPASIKCHRLIFLKTMKLFPSACLPIFKKAFLLG